jgi:hypothetical protein
LDAGIYNAYVYYTCIRTQSIGIRKMLELSDV